jgi:hypothetical protein
MPRRSATGCLTCFWLRALPCINAQSKHAFRKWGNSPPFTRCQQSGPVRAQCFRFRTNGHKRWPIYSHELTGATLHQAHKADGYEISLMKGNIHLRAATMAPLVQELSLMLGRPVIDRTGLTGRYNLDLLRAPDELSPATDARPTNTSANSGLKLQTDLLSIQSSKCRD